MIQVAFIRLQRVNTSTTTKINNSHMWYNHSLQNFPIHLNVVGGFFAYSFMHFESIAMITNWNYEEEGKIREGVSAIYTIEALTYQGCTEWNQKLPESNQSFHIWGNWVLERWKCLFSSVLLSLKKNRMNYTQINFKHHLNSIKSLS